MKKFSKLFAGLIASSMFLTACSGAGNNANNNEDAPADTGTAETAQTDTTANPDNSATISVIANSEWVDFYERAVERVNEKYPNATVNILEMDPLDHLDLVTQTDATNPDVADLIIMPADGVEDYVKSDIIMPFDALSLAEEMGGWDDFENGLAKSFYIDGEYYGFPRNIETIMVYANRSNALQKGINLDQPLEISELTDESTALLPFFDGWYGVAATNSAGITLLGKNDDGSLYSDVTKDWNELTDEQKAAFEGLYSYWKLHNDAGTPLFDADAGWGYIDDTFTTGNGGVFRLGGPWNVNACLDQAGDDLEIYPLNKITLNGNDLVHWKSGWGFALNSRLEGQEDEIELCRAMIKEVMNPEFADEFFNETGLILENVSSDVYENSDKLGESDKAIIKVVAETYKDNLELQTFREWNQLWDTWKNSILSWNSVQPQNAEEAYKQIKASFDSFLANMQ